LPTRFPIPAKEPPEDFSGELELAEREMGLETAAFS
jgi:hypothetical protein